MIQRHTVTKKQLRDLTYAAAYLQECVQNGPGAFYAALREVVQAQEGGFAWLAKRTGLGRASLYKALSEDGNPSYITIHRVLEAMGLDLAVAGTYKTMKRTDPHNSSLIMDRVTIDYKTPSRVLQTQKSRLGPPGTAKSMEYHTAGDSSALHAELDDMEQERFRSSDARTIRRIRRNRKGCPASSPTGRRHALLR